ncbi:MAG: S1-C subfamily serine protease [Planctomycetota bacterium]|jgi:S1-C subfamily serine protease
MKRTLIEVFCGLAALVLMVSFHHQIARLEVQQTDVSALERKFDDAVANQSDGSELEALRTQILDQTEARMQSLERQLQVAATGSDQAKVIASELERAQRDVKTFRSEMSSDFERTKALVDAYISEVRAKEQNAAMRMSETQGQIATLASKIYQDKDELTDKMLLPTVQLNGDDTVGSGTIVFSGPNKKNRNKIETYVLTSYHVVRNILADTPRANKTGFDVTVYLADENLIVKGRMVASEPKIDAALVQLETERLLPNVANVLPRNETNQVKVWDQVCAVGCPLGNDPVPSKGEVSSLNNMLNGANYWMVNAPTYFGNSGGGIYRSDTRQLIGVFSKIYTHGKGQPVVVPHMGLCTPMDLVYEWLTEAKMDHLLKSSSINRIDLRQMAAPAGR